MECFLRRVRGTEDLHETSFEFSLDSCFKMFDYFILYSDK
jgi:hypothetical protein